MSPAVFVTGATGYVGQRVVTALSGAGWHVTALSRQPARTPMGAGVRFVTGNLRTVSSYARELAGCAAVVHCARSNTPDEEQRAREDVEDSLALWKAAQAADVPRFIHLSTISVYAVPAEGLVTEDSPYTSLSDPYSQSKVRIEQQLLARTDGPQVCILQPGCVYGGRGGWWSGALPDMMRRGTVLLPDYGRGTANLIHVADMAHAVQLVVAAPAAAGRYIITDGRPVPWSEYYDLLEASIGQAATLRLSTDDCRALAAQLRNRSVLARLRRVVTRRLRGQRPVFPPTDHAITQAVSRAVFSPSRAEADFGFTAARRLAPRQPRAGTTSTRQAGEIFPFL